MSHVEDLLELVSFRLLGGLNCSFKDKPPFLLPRPLHPPKLGAWHRPPNPSSRSKCANSSSSPCAGATSAASATSSDASAPWPAPAATNDLVVKLLALLQQDHSNQVSETAWQRGARPAEKANAENPDEAEIRKRLGPNAQIVSSPHATGDKERKFYFTDLPNELQRVLRVQLRRPGDVSAVIEMPGGCQVYVCKEKTGETLSVATFSLPKRSYEQWLAEYDKGTQSTHEEHFK